MSIPITYIDLLMILVLTLLVSIAISVYIHNRNSNINRLFSLFMLNVTAWLFLSMLHFLFRQHLAVLLAFQTAVGSFMGITFYYFALVIVDEQHMRRRWENALAIVPAAIAGWYIITIIHPDLLADFNSRVRYEGIKLHRPGDLPYWAYTTWLFSAFIMGYGVLISGLRRKGDTQARKRIRNVLWASILGQLTTLGINNLSSILGLGQPGWIALMPILASLCWIGVSIIRDRIWTVEYLLEVIRQSEEKLGERNRIIEADLELARLIQKKLLPDKAPQLPGLGVHAVYLPVDKVGGDYYDFIVEHNVLGVLLADVSGHGIASAFLSSIIKMGFNYHAGSNGPALFKTLDRLVAEKGANAMFATAVFCRIDTGTMRLTSCRAGHCPPLVIRSGSGEIVSIETPGRALGMNLGEPRYHIGEIELSRGDRIFLYTDGVTETMNSDRVLFDEERLKNALREGMGYALEEFCEKLLAKLKEFSGDNPQGDDITIIAVEVK